MHTGALFLMSDEQPMSQSCLYLHTYHITVFLITVLVTLLSITVSLRSSHGRVLFYQTSNGGDLSPRPPQVLVVKARCIYRRIVTSNGYLGSEQRASFSVMDRRMVLYPLVFVFCWGPGLFSADSDWFLLMTDTVSEVSACLCLSCCFLSGDSGVSASGGSCGVPGQSRGGPLHPAGESVPEKHDHIYTLSSFSLFLVVCCLFLRLLNNLFDLDLSTVSSRTFLWLNLILMNMCVLIFWAHFVVIPSRLCGNYVCFTGLCVAFWLLCDSSCRIFQAHRFGSLFRNHTPLSGSFTCLSCSDPSVSCVLRR